MKKVIIIASAFLLILFSGIIIPKIVIKDFNDKFNDTTEEYKCAKEQTKALLNPIERLFTTKIAVTGRGFLTSLNVYTLFGIRYADVEITSCPEGSGQIDRIWF